LPEPCLNRHIVLTPPDEVTQRQRGGNGYAAAEPA